MERAVFWVFMIAVVVGGGLLIYYKKQNEAQPPEIPITTAPTTAPKEPVSPVVRYPLPDISTPAPEPAEKQDNLVVKETKPPPQDVTPLPMLEESDNPLKAELNKSFVTPQDLDRLFNLKKIIRRFVVTVDNLPRAKLPRKYLSTRSVDGSFLVVKQGDILFLDEKNFSRYTAYIDLLEAVDNQKLMAVYIYFYPLFQQSYEDLGYPDAYFNDRLIDVIDHLLETPELDGPIRLAQPHVLYTFADEELEKLSAGQKALLRSGQQNVQRVKTKLRELRAALVSQVKKTDPAAKESATPD